MWSYCKRLHVCTCLYTKMHWIKLCLMVLCISVRTSAQCIPRYITRPIDGYSCHISVFRNISDIQFQQCIHACLGSKLCWTLSYHNAGKHCLLADGACVSAERRDGFCMMILSTTRFQQCLHWIPFNGTYGYDHGYPQRAVQTPMRNNRVATVARSITDDGLLTGRSTSYRYEAYVLDSQQNTFKISGSYDILVVDDACSTAWVPYSAGEPIPVGAVGAGNDQLSRTHYIVGPKHSMYLYFTTYIHGEHEAYYYEGDSVTSFTDMYMLVSLA